MQYCLDPLQRRGDTRDMGMSRQSVQRVADLLVANGMCAYEENPAHRARNSCVRARQGLRPPIRAIDPLHGRVARALAADLGSDQLAVTLAAMQRLSAALDAVAVPLASR